MSTLLSELLRDEANPACTQQEARRDVLESLHQSYICRDYDFTQDWTLDEARVIINHSFRTSYKEKKQEFASLKAQSEDCFCFTSHAGFEVVRYISDHGLHVNLANSYNIGRNSKGVSVYLYADVLLRLAELHQVDVCWLVVYKIMFGRVLAVEGSGYDPAPYADCYLSKARPQPSEPPIDQIFKSQVYLYERENTANCYSSRPRQCCPLAFMKFVSKRRGSVPQYPLPVADGFPPSTSSAASLPAPPRYPYPVLRATSNDPVVASAGRSGPSTSLPSRLPVPAALSSLNDTANSMSNRQPTEARARGSNRRVAQWPTSGGASSTTACNSAVLHPLEPAMSAAPQLLAGRFPPTSNSASATCRPPLTRCRTAAVGGPAPTTMPYLHRTVNAAAAVPDTYRSPATSLYRQNDLSAAQPCRPPNVNISSNFSHAAPTSSYGGVAFSSAGRPPGYREQVLAPTVAQRTDIPAYQHAVPTIPSASGSSSTGRSRDVWSLLQQHRHLVKKVMYLSVYTMRDALVTIKRALTDQYCGTFPCVGEAWNRLCAIGSRMMRVSRQYDVYTAFFRRVDCGAVDVGSVDVATLERSSHCLQDSVRRMEAIFKHLRRWYLPDDGNSQPSDGALAACAAGMADEIVRLADEFLCVLTATETTMMLTAAVPSSSSSSETLQASDVQRDVPTVRQQPAATIDDVINRVTPAAFEQFRLSPGIDERQRIAARFLEDVDCLLSSQQSPVFDNLSSTTSHNSDHQAASDAAVVHPLIVIAPDGGGSDDGTSQCHPETKFSRMMSTDGPRRRTRRTDLGTVDLDPVDNDNGRGLLPPDVPSSNPTSPNVEDVIVAPAINVASENNFGLDLFVQFSVPPTDAVTELVEGSGGNAFKKASGVGSVTTTEFDIKPFESLFNYDVECYGQPSATLSTVPYLPENRLPQQKQNLAVPGNGAEESIRFSLSSDFQESYITFAQQQEMQEVEQRSTSCNKPFDVDNDDNKDVVLHEQQARTPASEPFIEISDNDEDACCQILDVFSLPPEGSNAMGSVVWHTTEPQPVTDHAPGPGTAASKTAKVSCRTTSVEDELITDIRNLNTTSTDFASNTSRNIQQDGDAGSRERCQSNQNRIKYPNNDDIAYGPMPSLSPQNVTGIEDNARPVKKRRGRPPGRRLNSNTATSSTRKYSQTKSVDQGLNSDCTTNDNEMIAPEFTWKFTKDVQQRRKVFKRKRRSTTSPDSMNDDVDHVSALPLCLKKVTVDEYMAFPVKRKPGRPPGLPSHSKTEMSSDTTGVRSQTKSANQDLISDLSTPDNDACEFTSSAKLSNDVQQKTDTVLRETFCSQEVTDSECVAPPVKRKPGRPPGRPRTAVSSSSVDAKKYKQKPKIGKATKHTAHFPKQDLIADLRTPDNDAREFTSCAKFSNVVQQKTDAVLRERCNSETCDIGYPINGGDAEHAPVPIFCSQEVTDSECVAPPVKRKPVRPPGRPRTAVSPSGVDAKKYKQKMENGKTTKHIPHFPKFQTDTVTDGKSYTSTENFSPRMRLFDQDLATDNKGVGSQPKKQPRASMRFWQPGSMVNLAPPSVGHSVPANVGEVGLGGEWKPVVPKKSLEPTSADHGVTDGQVVSDLPSTCVEMEQQWSDVEPMTPPQQTPTICASSQQRTSKTDGQVYEDISDDEEPQKNTQPDEPRRLVIDPGTVNKGCVEKSVDDPAEDDGHATSDSKKAADPHATSSIDGSLLTFGTKRTSALVNSGGKGKQKSRRMIKGHHRSKNSLKEELQVLDSWKPKLQDTENRIMTKLRRRDVTLNQPERHTKEHERKQQAKKASFDRSREIKGSASIHSSSRSSSPSSATTHDDMSDRSQAEIRLAMRDMLSMRLASDGLGYKSRMVFVLPDCLRLKCEVGHYVSEEGVLLFVRHLRISIEDWVKLSALSTELGQLRSPLSNMSHYEASGSSDGVLAVTVEWLHRRRRRLLKTICCTTKQQRDDLLHACQKKLNQYRNAKSALRGTDDRNLDQFVTHSLPSIARTVDVLRTARIKDRRWHVGGVSRNGTTPRELMSTGETSTSSQRQQTGQLPHHPAPAAHKTSTAPATKPRAAKSPDRSANSASPRTASKMFMGSVHIERLSKQVKLAVETINKRDISSSTSVSVDQPQEQSTSPGPSSTADSHPDELTSPD